MNENDLLSEKFERARDNHEVGSDMHLLWCAIILLATEVELQTANAELRELQSVKAELREARQ